MGTEMVDKTKIESNIKSSLLRNIIFVIFVFIFFTGVFLIFPPAAIDWRHTFYQVAKTPLHPFDIRPFMNIPWTALILYPFRYFLENISLAMNASLSLIVFGLLVIKRKGKSLPLVLTLTSYPFLALIANGSIEWIPALGFILQNEWGIPLLLAKPQSGILAIFAWVSSFKNKILLFLPAIIIIALSFIVWGNWLVAMMANVQYMQSANQGLSSWNISLFPWSIPVGLGLMFYVIKYQPVDGELLGILATFCLVPYFAVHSLAIFFALLSVSHRRIAIGSWLLLWLYPVVSHWMFITQLLGIH